MAAKTPEEALADSIHRMNLQNNSPEYQAALMRNNMMKRILREQAEETLNADSEFKALQRRNAVAKKRESLKVQDEIGKDLERSRLKRQLLAIDAYNELSEAERVKIENHKQKRAQEAKQRKEAKENATPTQNDNTKGKNGKAKGKKGKAANNATMAN